MKAYNYSGIKKLFKIPVETKIETFECFICMKKQKLSKLANFCTAKHSDIQMCEYCREKIDHCPLCRSFVGKHYKNMYNEQHPFLSEAQAFESDIPKFYQIVMGTYLEKIKYVLKELLSFYFKTPVILDCCMQFLIEKNGANGLKYIYYKIYETYFLIRNERLVEQDSLHLAIRYFVPEFKLKPTLKLRRMVIDKITFTKPEIFS